VDLRPHRALIALALAAAAVTLLAATVGDLHVAYRSPSLHLALETVAALVALLVSYLLLQRFLFRQRSMSLLLFAAFLMIGVSHLAFLVVPAAIPSVSDRFATWAAVVSALVVGALLVGAAFGPARTIRRSTRAAAEATVLVLVVLVLIGGVMAAFRSHLPVGINPALSPAEGPRVTGHPLLLASQAVGMVLFALAAVGFARRAARRQDGFLEWIAAGTLLGAFSRLNYFLFPSLYSHWVYVGDFFRLAFYVVLLIGAALEIRRYQQQAARTAMLEERRRIARDLHDGLAQELAFILFEGRRLAAEAPDARADRIVDAARRALVESREAIATLASDGEQPLEVAVQHEALALATRTGAHARFQVDPDLHPDFEVRDALLRIVREAVTNATSHGKAKTVDVALSNNGSLVLRVTDDGVGFDPAAVRGGGFGLSSMRERAEGLGGKLRIESRPGGGTTVEAIVP
jgi:signal transduction histidine kinase